MAKLICEVSDEIIVESIDDKNFYVSGVFSSYGVKNKNGRTYTESVLKREANKLQEDIKNKCLFGELSHPARPSIDPSEIAILIEDLSWQGQHLMGKALVLDTPKGKIAKEIMKHGKLGISSRGLGTVNESGYVNEDFKCVTWDLVLGASNPASKFVNGIYEGEEFFTMDELSRINNEKEAQKILQESQDKEKEILEAQNMLKSKIWQVLDKIQKEI